MLLMKALSLGSSGYPMITNKKATASNAELIFVYY